MSNTGHHSLETAFVRVFSIIKLGSKEIYAIYVYSILVGLLQLSLPLGIQSIINFVMAGSFSASMVILITVVVVGVFLAGVLQISQMKLNEKIQQNIFVQYALEFAYRIPRIDIKSVDGSFMPELINRFFDVVSLQKGLSKLLLDLPTASIQILFGLLLLSFYNAVFIFFGLLLLFLLWLILKFTSKNGFDTSIEESEYKFAVAAWLQESGRIMKSLKFARSTDIAVTKTDDNVSGYLKARTSHFRILLVQYWALIIFKVLITLAMLVVGAILLIDQQLNIGQFVATEIVIITVLASIEKFILSLDKVYDVLTAVEKLGIVIDKPLEADGVVKLDTSKGISIDANNVSFSFDKENKVLQDVSLKVPAGSVVCLAGPEGTGKSTLLRLFTGSYNTFEGQILINGLPIGNYSIESLRNATGIYFSQQDIFGGTLWENLALGECAYTPQEMAELADKIGLGQFLSTLPNGFATELDPMGRRLNKSTRQRLLFLRAIAGKPKLLLLEEPWEGLSDAAQENIIQFLKTEMKDCTIVVATNSQSFMKVADSVVHL